jgi:CheY-like chemotaxis protein
MNDLAGLKALLVEDEGGIALMIEDMLEEFGCKIVASVARLRQASDVASTAAVDFAILDVNIDGQEVFPVARVLRTRGIPFVFSTGYGAGGLPPEFSATPVVGKPFTIEGLRSAILAALTPGSSSQPNVSTQ